MDEEEVDELDMCRTRRSVWMGKRLRSWVCVGGQCGWGRD